MSPIRPIFPGDSVHYLDMWELFHTYCVLRLNVSPCTQREEEDQHEGACQVQLGCRIFSGSAEKRDFCHYDMMFTTYPDETALQILEHS